MVCYLTKKTCVCVTTAPSANLVSIVYYIKHFPNLLLFVLNAVR